LYPPPPPPPFPFFFFLASRDVTVCIVLICWLPRVLDGRNATAFPDDTDDDDRTKALLVLQLNANTARTESLACFENFILLSIDICGWSWRIVRMFLTLGLSTSTELNGTELN